MMSFLDECSERRKTVSNIQEPEEDQPEQPEDDAGSPLLSPSPVSAVPQKSSSSSSSLKNSVDNAIPKYLQQQSKDKENSYLDEDLLFGRLLIY